MIVDLTVENFKSFLEETRISFVAGQTSRLSGNLLRQQNGERIVKSMALYGPNASGKTNIIDGLYALHNFALFSSQDQKPTAKVPGFDAFALDKKFKKFPARVAMTVDLDGKRYTYDVSATREMVWNETLIVRDLSARQRRKVSWASLIERTWNPSKKKYTIKLNEEHLPDSTRIAAMEQTAPNRLMLGKLSTMNSEFARRIIQWFDEDVEFYDMHRNRVIEEKTLEDAAKALRKNRDFAETFTRLIRDADTGIQELRVTDEIALQLVTDESERTVEVKEQTRPSLTFRHTSEDGSETYFRRQSESSGTLRFTALLAAILQPGHRRRLVCIDELSASLHSDLVCRLVQIVHSSQFNQLGSQLLFTTHDTHLIDPSRILRRDQITFCGKDRFGRSATVRMDEFQDTARSDANLAKQYLDGRFGYVPQFGPSLEDVQVDEEPLEVGT